MLKQLIATSVACLTLVACGPTSGNPDDPNDKAGNGNSVGQIGGGSTTFEVKVVSLALPLDNADVVGKLDPNTLQATLENPADVLAGKAASATPVAVQGCKKTDDGANHSIECSVTLTGDANKLTQGAIISLSDKAPAASGDSWQVTNTVLDANAIKAGAATKKVMATAYASTTGAGNGYKAVTGAADTKTLFANGAVVFQVLGTDGKPVKGAAIKAPDSFKLTYANDDVTKANDDAANAGKTAAGGVVIAVPQAKQTAVSAATDWSVTAPEGQTEAWTVPAIVAVPAALTVELLSPAAAK